MKANRKQRVAGKRRRGLRRHVPWTEQAVVSVVALPVLVDGRRGPKVRWAGEDNG
jgi:hypothetical protein